MQIYIYDEKGVFQYEETAQIDPLETQINDRIVYLLPPNCTTVKPELKNGFTPVWNGEAWEQVEDNRGTKYWLEGDKYGTQARVMTELGKLPEGAILTAPEMTQEQKIAQTQARLTQAVQTHLDSKAQELNYDSCLSVCSYINTGNAKFDAEGEAFRSWRSQVWAKGYEILDACLAGEREIPTAEELISELPELAVDYSE